MFGTLQACGVFLVGFQHREEFGLKKDPVIGQDTCKAGETDWPQHIFIIW